MEFMSCSSTQGHCRTQTHHKDFLRFFIWSSTHTMYFADCQLIYYTWQKCQAVLAARHITSEQSQGDWRVMSNRTRPADPSCNMDSHLVRQASRANSKLKMKYQMKQHKAWDQRQKWKANMNVVACATENTTVHKITLIITWLLFADKKTLKSSLLWHTMNVDYNQWSNERIR